MSLPSGRGKTLSGTEASRHSVLTTASSGPDEEQEGINTSRVSRKRNTVSQSRHQLCALDGRPQVGRRSSAFGPVGGWFYDARVSSQLPLEPDAGQRRLQEQGKRSWL